MLPSTYSDQHTWPPFLGLDAAVSQPVIIDKMELFRFRDLFLVRTTSRDGQVGVATTNSRAQYFWPMFTQLVAPAFVGRDARELESLVNEVYIYKNNYKYQGTPFWNCVAYAEASVFDLLGQVANKSVGDLLGGRWRDQIPIYLSSMRRDTTPEEEVAWVGERLAETGARAVKLKIGGRMRNNADSLPGRVETLIPLARKTWGDEITLYVDANGSYDHRQAIEVGRLLEAHNYAWLEEPCPFEQYEETKRVADALDIDVAGGEQDCNLGHFRVMIRERHVDMVQPDLMYNGGLIRALRVAQMAQEAGIRVTPHSPKHNPELATLLHFASVVRHTGPFLEFPARRVSYEDWYAPHFTIQEGGYLNVPTGPGLGIEYDESIWQQAEYL
jgi:L-alanine-DL-glutamate epimerase-like enolase superfamily enzyme